MGTVRELSRDDPALSSAESFAANVICAAQPIVMRGLGAHLPAVTAGTPSPAAALGYIQTFDCGQRPEVFHASADAAGRYFYNGDLSGFNFERETLPLSSAFARMLRQASGEESGTTYVGSLLASHYLPGFAEANRLPVVPSEVAARLWIGNGSHVACHYDAYENIACVLAGSRRFTLYPPDAIGDLYVGPIDHTMAGQPVSMAAADPEKPAYPRFAAARQRALVVNLAPGDALFLPKLWWHQVEADAPVNVMLNYWWDATAIGPDAPMLSMLHAMITIAERPAAERDAFRAFFDHFVFRPDGHPLAHLPQERRGVLGSLRGGGYGQIRAMILRALRGG
ncbi:MAG: transcriptional regulator [Novosphingobium sp. 17-62-19]|uniref:cupin-like domain-containing protein n=1 Tax=Novosphingobium sp. 17-62-19 TaxID=1970406 RepID=UPI000BD097D3|nr:cupin-like domain-containing protein [Novosphingobium sp. 17-62-19]OYX95150.1 MAG: transcriptional regulator [Novosphingobium sp. 35-62-5]OZA21616.1 MAG: transcriptional regulator [Novosphingobium sp. 17-62-19]HQS95872.1 cupin-like domain-containing protein [Novosphingobium sp.]